MMNEDEELKKIEEEIKEIEKKLAEVKGDMETPRVKKAVQLLNNEKPIGMIALWEDGKVTLCVTSPHDEKLGGCYTIKDGDEKIFYMVQAWFTGLSKDIKVKHVE